MRSAGSHSTSGMEKEGMKERTGLGTIKSLLNCYVLCSPVLVGRQMGLMFSVIGTLSLSRSSAMSWSKFMKLKSPVVARNTNLLSGLVVWLQRSCSPNVTLIMNHMNL